MGRFGIMRLLLDTHAALWWWDDSPALGKRVREAMSEPATEVYFSAASAYEIHQKLRLGKLELPAGLQGEGLLQAAREEGWRLLPLQAAEASAAASLDHPHRDLFDRMLAAQARLGQLTLASRDPFFSDLQLDLIW